MGGTAVISWSAVPPWPSFPGPPYRHGRHFLVRHTAMAVISWSAIPPWPSFPGPPYRHDTGSLGRLLWLFRPKEEPDEGRGLLPLALGLATPCCQPLPARAIPVGWAGPAGHEGSALLKHAARTWGSVAPSRARMRVTTATVLRPMSSSFPSAPRASDLAISKCTCKMLCGIDRVCGCVKGCGKRMHACTRASQMHPSGGLCDEQMFQRGGQRPCESMVHGAWCMVLLPVGVGDDIDRLSLHLSSLLERNLQTPQSGFYRQRSQADAFDVLTRTRMPPAAQPMLPRRPIAVREPNRACTHARLAGRNVHNARHASPSRVSRLPG
jgi:hypothetical protein